MGFRPKLGSIFYSPSLELMHWAKLTMTAMAEGLAQGINKHHTTPFETHEALHRINKEKI